MFVREIMHQNPTCCALDTPITEAAQMMREFDYGFLPIVDGEKRAIGVITDRDLVCRGLAESDSPTQTPVAQCMSTPVLTVRPDADVNACLEVMKQNQVKRVVVQEQTGGCLGIVSYADLANSIGDRQLGEVASRVAQTDHPIHP